MTIAAIENKAKELGIRGVYRPPPVRTADPADFFRAGSSLSVQPAECVVVEDSAPGIRGAGHAYTCYLEAVVSCLV